MPMNVIYDLNCFAENIVCFITDNMFVNFAA